MSQEKSRKILFRATTSEAHTIKSLFDSVYYYLKHEGCLILDKGGIFLDGMDQEKKISCKVCLLSKNFTTYTFRWDQTKQVILDLYNLNRLLKQIKKKDKLKLIIYEDDPNFLYIHIISKDSDKQAHLASRIPIQEALQIRTIFPKGYGFPITLPATEFQRVCRGMTGINNHVLITSEEQRHIRFYCNGDDLLEREGVFGNEDSDDEVYEEEKVDVYKQTFSTAYISRIGKLATGLKSVRVFLRDKNGKSEESLPIRFNLNVGCVGEIDIFIKSIEQLQKEELLQEQQEDECEEDCLEI